MTELVHATAKLLPERAHRMSLANIVRGPIAKPIRLLVYGVDGIGKTTLAAGAPSPIFIGVEDGTATLDVPRFPEPKVWADLHFAIDELGKPDHTHRTVVIDTLDWLEPLCWTHVCTGKRNKAGKLIETIEDFDYGRGYGAALDEWRVLLARLDRLRNTRGMGIVLLAHASIRQFKNPEGEDYDRYELKLNAKASGLIREWSDAVLFATHETYTHQKDKNAPTKGISTGARIMHTTRRAAFDAKNRHSLPETLPLDWQSLEDAIAVGQTASPELLVTRIRAQLEGASEDLRARVEAAIAKAGGNAGELARVANKLAAQMSITKQEAER